MFLRNTRQIVIEFIFVKAVEVLTAVVKRRVDTLQERHEELLVLEVLGNLDRVKAELDVVIPKNPVH